MKKNQVISEVEVLGVAAEGKCIVKHDEKVIFIAGNLVAPGDVVDLKIIRKKRRFFEAIPVHFHRLSDLRQTPFCSHFGTCGGCKWQHLDYSEQLKYKQQQVIDNLQRIGKLDLPEIQAIKASENTQYYRNKLEYTFSAQRWLTQEEMQQKDEAIPEEKTERKPPPYLPGLGFHIPGRFDKILDIDHCYLQSHISNEIRNAIRDYAIQHQLLFFNLREQHGLLRNLVIRNTTRGDLMVMVIFFEHQEKEIQELMAFLKQRFPEISSLYFLINPKKNDSYQDLEPQLYAGKAYIEENMEDLTFRIGPKSFFQTNAHQALLLYQITRDFAELKKEDIVYDLYTGTGTIANFVARQCKKVVGIEYVEEAIQDAHINSKINGIDNTRFFAGDMKDLLKPDFIQKNDKPDLVISDPPRAGMHADVIKVLLEASPDRIVYVSCNPATQARDLALMDAQYEVQAVQPVDMFPHTYHVENVVKLKKRS